MTWIDITTSYYWNRPAVGIIRVEFEILKSVFDLESDEYGYFRFDNELEEFIKVDKEGVKTVIDKISNPYRDETARIKCVNNIENVKKDSLFQYRKYEFRHFSKLIIKNIFYMLLSFVNPSFHGKITNKFIHLKILIKHFFHRFKKKKNNFEYSEDILSKESNNEKISIFSNHDKILSLGATWNYSQYYKSLYNIKKNLNIKLYSISYDLIPIYYPQYCLDNVVAVFHKLYYDLCWMSSHIFCISKSTQNDLNNFIKETGCPKPQLSIVNLGSNIIDSEEFKISEKIEKFLEGKEYILYVSTIERRKNHQLLYSLVSYWIDNKITDFPEIILVGMPGWGTDELMKDLELNYRVKNKIHILNHINDSELSYIYNKSLFTVYPSYYEGWGLPVAESLTYNKFCIASNTSSLPEVGQDLIECISPYDLIEWSNKILFYFNNRDELRSREINIKKNYKEILWKQLTDDILERVKSN